MALMPPVRRCFTGGRRLRRRVWSASGDGAGAAVGLRRAGAAGGGSRQPAEETCELFELGGGEVGQEQALDALDVRAARVPELDVTGVGQAGVGDACVAVAGDALDQALADKSVDQPRDAR